MIEKGKDIILFDGVCNLCDSSINFVIKNDPKSHFVFTALQSKSGKQLIERYNIETSKLDSIILIKNDTAYAKSTAALKIAKSLSKLWPLLYIFIIVPLIIRNGFYDYIAKNRYNWYGKKDACMVPTPELKSRFLD